MSISTQKHTSIFFLAQITILAALITLQTSCKKEDDCEAPVIEYITVYTDDTEITDLIPGEQRAPFP